MTSLQIPVKALKIAIMAGLKNDEKGHDLADTQPGLAAAASGPISTNDVDKLEEIIFKSRPRPRDIAVKSIVSLLACVL